MTREGLSALGGLALLGAALLGGQAAAGSWYGGGPGCDRMEDGCEAALCAAYTAFGDVSAKTKQCTINPATRLATMRVELNADGSVDGNAYARFSCLGDERTTEVGCEPRVVPEAEMCVFSPDGRVGNPIDVISGAKTETAVDLRLGEGPQALTLKRHYRSTSRYGFEQDSPLSRGWRTNFHFEVTYSSVVGDQPRTVKIRFPDGRETYFRPWVGSTDYRPGYSLGRTSSDVFNVTSGANPNRLVFDDGVLTLTTDRREVFRFDVVTIDDSGSTPVFDIRLSEVANRDGRLWTVTHNADGEPGRVEDRFGNAIDFFYNDDGRLIEARGSHGVSAFYSYEELTSLSNGLTPTDGFLNDTPDPSPGFIPFEFLGMSTRIWVLSQAQIVAPGGV